jgi:hypothetical protein
MATRVTSPSVIGALTGQLLGVSLFKAELTVLDPSYYLVGNIPNVTSLKLSSLTISNPSVDLSGSIRGGRHWRGPSGVTPILILPQ